VIFQQVDFIHVEDGLVGPGQQPGSKRRSPLDRAASKSSALSAGLPKPQREVHQPIGAVTLEGLPFTQPFPAKIAQPFVIPGWTAKRAIGYQFHGRE